MDSKCKTIDVRKMKINITSLFLCIGLGMTMLSFAQSERKWINDGNRMYEEKKYSDAEVSYKKALGVQKDSKYGHYNLGNAYYKQQKYEDAIAEYATLAGRKNLDKQELQSIYHNLGNANLQAKKYEESIREYKKALKLNPADEDTRYNLAYAQAMLKKDQQQNKQKQNQDQQNNQDQNKEQQQQQQSSQDQKKQEQQQQKQSQKISKEDAEKILRALNNDEKNIQKKMQKKEEKKMKIEKNW